VNDDIRRAICTEVLNRQLDRADGVVCKNGRNLKTGILNMPLQGHKFGLKSEETKIFHGYAEPMRTVNK